MDLPLFALHTVLYPGRDLSLHVFEERYLQMMEDVLPEAPFAIAAIRRGQEVGGPYDPYRIGVLVLTDEFELNDDGSYDVTVRAVERIRLLEATSDRPYSRWSVESFPDEDGAEPGVLAKAVMSAVRFLDAAGVEGELDVSSDAAEMSYTLAALVPGLVPERQALLEIPSASERLSRLGEIFTMEAGLLRALRERRER